MIISIKKCNPVRSQIVAPWDQARIAAKNQISILAWNSTMIGISNTIFIREAPSIRTSILSQLSLYL